MANLTILRVKQGLSQVDHIIKDRLQLLYSPVTVGKTVIAHLYARRVERKRPGWLTFFGGSVDFGSASLKTASLAAVLLIKEGDEFFVAVFGYGRSLLHEGVTDERFGLRATLNAVEPSKLRSIDHKRLEAISRHTREQLSREGGLDHFGLDVNRDLLRAVTGAPSDPTLGSRMSGSDALTVTAEITIEGLGKKAAAYARLSEKNDYAQNFPWVDNIQDVRDPVLIGELDKKLAKELAKDTGDIWIAPPEIIDWGAIKGFRYRTSKKAVEYTDLRLDDYFFEQGGPASIDAGQLLNDRIYLVRADDESAQHSWSVHRCLIAEIVLRGRKFVLNEGKWYEIEPNFISAVETDIADLLKPRTDLPKYADKDEDAYVRRVAKNDQAFALLHTKNIPFPGHSKVEACDLFKERTFVHVKRHTSGSGTLSHLFAQGSVSGELMLREPSFRYEFHQRLPKQFQTWDPGLAIDPGKYEVCYAIVQRPKRTLDLPFFSKVSLRAAAASLRGMGYQVSLCPIEA